MYFPHRKLTKSQRMIMHFCTLSNFWYPIKYFILHILSYFLSFFFPHIQSFFVYNLKLQWFVLNSPYYNEAKPFLTEWLQIASTTTTELCEYVKTFVKFCESIMNLRSRENLKESFKAILEINPEKGIDIIKRYSDNVFLFYYFYYLIFSFIIFKNHFPCFFMLFPHFL